MIGQGFIQIIPQIPPHTETICDLTHEQALEAALDQGRIAGCAMDVGRASDQMPTPGLAARADVIATPHAAGLTLPAIEHQSMETVAQAAEIVKGRPPKGAVNAEHWTRKPKSGSDTH